MKPKPVIKNYSGTNGALAAAMKVGTHLLPPAAQRTNSDSHIAANLAASRSSSLSPMNTGQRPQLSPVRHSSLYSPNLPRSPSVSSTTSNAREYGQKLETHGDVKHGPQRKIREVEQVPAGRGNHDHTLDTTSIPPTNKLISIFEDKSPPRDTTVRAKPVPKPPSLQRKIQNNADQTNISKDQEKSKSLAVKPASKSPKPISYKVPAAAQNLQRRSSVHARSRSSTAYDKLQDESSSDDSFVSASDFKENDVQKTMVPSQSIQKPQPPPPRGSMKKEVPSEDRGRRKSVDQMEFRVPIPKARMSKDVITEDVGRRQSVPEMEYRGAFIPHLTGDSIANAVAAGSLASSRAASPSRAPTKHSLLQQHRLQDSRTPSPAKGGLRKTLRNPPKEHEEEDQLERRGRKKLLHKHPHKHAEGDRKRWRDEITERERKRYEAVWASNKGLFLQNPNPNSNPNNPISDNDISNPANLVSNIVVRDIWQRSRLGPDVLEEVWDLVNRTKPFVLTREEFVVGLWLIDQRLKGRKLPVKVGESVWASARGVGVRVKVRG